MSKPRILVQLDVDPHPSVFDAVVAIDAEIDQLLQYGRVEATDVQSLVHGTMFTRGPEDLQNTAIFVGGANVSTAEAVLKQVTASFFGPLRVSVLFDANGANTTAAAAVRSAASHVDLASTTATVLAATGPVGQRAVRLLAREGARVRVASRSQDRAANVCQSVEEFVAGARVEPYATGTAQETLAALEGSEIVISAGAVGIELVSDQVWSQLHGLRVAIDLNAVPPTGIAGIDPMDKAKRRNETDCYGAIGVGGLKMKIHKAAVKKLFEANDQVLDAEEIYEIAKEF
jgi:hypothetical protein